MRVLIFGINGMLGHKLYQEMQPRFDVFGTLREGFDSVSRFGIFEKENIVENVDGTDRESIRRAIYSVKPDCIINAIGIIKQLPASKNVIATLSINSIFPRHLAEFSREYGFRLITISTDCVFDGAKGNYSEADPPDARDLYGMSKLFGEIDANNALTIRTSIIGRELETGHSIVEWFLGNRGGSVSGYEKAIYTGFPTIVLAGVIADIIENRPELSGIYHVSSNSITKLDLLRLLNKYFEANIRVEPSDKVAIDRSLDSSRFRNETGFLPETWDKMIAEMAADPTPYDSWRSKPAQRF